VKKSKREEVLKLLETDRDRSDASVAREAGCVSSYVHKLRKQVRSRAEIHRQDEWIKSLLLDPWFDGDIYDLTQVAKKVGCSYRHVEGIYAELKVAQEHKTSVLNEATKMQQEHTSVSVPATGLSAEVKRSYVETNDLPPAPVEVVTRSSILSTARSYITRDRQADHGDAEDNFSRIAGYWSLHTGVTLTATDVAVMMALLKVARIKQNPQHVDNWVDGAGYFACGGEIANK
jgi:hypothetical protein